MLLQTTLFYIIVVLQHPYFNNKTSSVHSSSINTSESLSDSFSLRVEDKMPSTGLRIDPFPPRE